MTTASQDLSGWARRDRRRKAYASTTTAHVMAHLPPLRALLTRFGVTEAFVFGSMARGTARPDSDLDLAVRGCDPARFDRMAAEVERLFEFETDVVDLGRAPGDFAELLSRDAMRVLP